MTKVYLGADHGGFSFKEKIKDFLDELEVKYEDLGNEKLEPRDDFVDYASEVAKKVKKTGGKGILICTNGFPGNRIELYLAGITPRIFIF